MSETMDAEEVSDLMNALWERIDVAIVEHGGHIDEHIDDAVMALWGVDAARESDPERAIRAALAMQAVLAEFRESHAVGMRIGWSTGPVLLGTVDTTGEFSAIGDVVGLAQQLEETAPTVGLLQPYKHPCGKLAEFVQSTMANVPRRHWIRIRELLRVHGAQIQAFCAHDAHELKLCQMSAR